MIAALTFMLVLVVGSIIYDLHDSNPPDSPV